MISLSILAIGLVALSDLNGTAVQMHAYARKATEATLLVQGKMLDMEELLQKEGFHDFDDEKHGNFDEEAPGYSWRAEILKPEIQLDEKGLMGMLGMGGGAGGSGSGSGPAGGAAPNGLTQALGGAGALLGGAGGAGGGGGALAAAAGPFAGLIQGQAKTFIETLKKSVREVRITVSWKEGKNERSISASQQLVILPEMIGKAGQTAPAAQAAPQADGGTTLPTVNFQQ